jgi:hypothetical protein
LDPGRPGRSSLYGDGPLLTVVNRNHHGTVVGVFHRQQAGAPASLLVGPAELPTPLEGTVAAYAHQGGTVALGGLTVTLAPQGWEVVTLSPIRDGVAIFGLAELLNSGGAIVAVTHAEDRCVIDLADGGLLVGWAARAPTVVAGALGEGLRWSPDSGRFLLPIHGMGPRQVVLRP